MTPPPKLELRSELRKQIKEIAYARMRFGQERITWLLQPDGLRMSAAIQNRFYRIYIHEGLQVRKRCRERECRLHKLTGRNRTASAWIAFA